MDWAVCLPPRLLHVFGQGGLKIDEATVATYWREARANGVPWALNVRDGIDRLPVKLFGGDARYGARNGEQIYAVFISCPLFRPRCARQSRWLIWSIRSSLFLGEALFFASAFVCFQFLSFRVFTIC